MPTINFPANPSVNDTYTFGGKTWIWNGAAWQLQSQGGINNIPIGNSTPSTGAFTTLTSTGNTTLGNIVGNVLPAANVTYDLGSTSQRWNDIWLANSTIYLGEANISASGTAVVLPANTSVGGAVVTAVPKITGFDYPGDDTAADPAGGQTILINGANFESGCIVYIDNSVVSPVGFVNSTQLSITSPAKATGTYSVYVVNPDGSTALALPGIIYSGVPAWSTAAGNIGAPYETTSFTTTLVATADSAVTYATAPGNSLPANLSLNSSTGNLSGTVPVANVDTTYTFSVRATDAELQDTDRQFSVTYKTDVVTWSAPANASSYTWAEGTANSVSMSATSAAGKVISFAVQSGSLPSNVSISGNLISGTPNVLQSNTSVVVRATAATTNRYADQTFYFTVVSGNPDRGLFGGGTSTSGTMNVIQYVTISSTGNATDFGDLTVSRNGAGACSSSTRGVFAGGDNASGTATNIIDYVTIASTGDATDFGDLIETWTEIGAGSSNSTRGLFSGGYSGSYQNIIQYITIASTGNASDFGDLIVAVGNNSGFSSPTRSISCGGNNTSGVPINVIQYVTIASTGNSTDFGDLLTVLASSSGCSSSTRGIIFAGVDNNFPTFLNTIQYVTMASTGDSTDFGDLSVGVLACAATSSDVRGLNAGGFLSNFTRVNTIEYITIASTGNAIDFGDLIVATVNGAACSSNHGGLQ